jgi:NADP-dependent 3-hydroxy acid dehydrogenase YdfG/acyl carrier protein
MVIHQEYPNIRTRSIDLELSEDASQHESAVDLILAECLDSGSGMFVAHRNRQRWIQSYEPIVLNAPGHGLSSFREGGVYLITGGLGNIGIAISEYLGRKYKAKLVLVGRSSKGARDAIARIQTLGAEVAYVSTNVADANGMRKAIEYTYQRFGALHGVIHTAGIVGDNGLQEINDCNYENCERHFQAKAHGLRVLEEVLDGKTLDFCLLVSSLTSVLGGVGHAAYASSNVFMDAFARRHNRSNRVPWLSVDFDLWRTDTHTTTDSHTADEAINAMETVLAARNASQLLVSTGDLTARINQWIKLESLSSHGDVKVASAHQPTDALSKRPRHGDSPKDETEERIAAVWQEVLGVDEVGINDNFSQLGGHSLYAIKIVTELRRAFQIDLPVRVLFDAPTVADLSRYIKEQIIKEIDSMSDEEVRHLTVNE